MRVGLLLVAATVAVVAGALVFGLTRSSGVASAAQVRAAVEHALASTGSISGVFIVDNAIGVPHTRWRFTADSTGAFRIDELTSGPEYEYNPASNIETTSAGSHFVLHTGLAPGPPDSAPGDFVIERGLGSVVAELAAASDAKVEEISYDSRPAWLVTSPNGLVTVDRATGVPVRDELLRDGKVAAEWRIEGLRVSPTVTAIAPLKPRPGQVYLSYGPAFRRVTPAEARSLAEYAPLLPQHLPSGFALSALAYAADAPATTPEDRPNPPSVDVISAAYRRGFDELVVTTRRTDAYGGSSAADWRDPLQTVASEPTGVTFTGGELAGQHGHLVLEPDALPHIWTAGPELVATIAGTVNGNELLRVANSLQAFGR